MEMLENPTEENKLSYIQQKRIVKKFAGVRREH